MITCRCHASLSVPTNLEKNVIEQASTSSIDLLFSSIFLFSFSTCFLLFLSSMPPSTYHHSVSFHRSVCLRVAFLVVLVLVVFVRLDYSVPANPFRRLPTFTVRYFGILVIVFFWWLSFTDRGEFRNLCLSITLEELGRVGTRLLPFLRPCAALLCKHTFFSPLHHRNHLHRRHFSPSFSFLSFSRMVASDANANSNINICV